MLKNSITLIPARKQLYQAKLVFYLFLGSLAMFFIASMITYLIIRRQAFAPHPDALPGSAMSGGPKSYTDLVLPVSCLLYTSPSPRDLSTSRMPSSA